MVLVWQCQSSEVYTPYLMLEGLAKGSPLGCSRRQGARDEDLEQGKAEPKMQGRFKGMVLQKLSGKTLADILGSKRSGVQDVHYLRAALLQVIALVVLGQML